MAKFLDHEIKLVEACTFTDKYRQSGTIDDEIIVFVENVISAIIPNMELFEDVLRMFGSKASEEQCVRFMNSP